MGSQSIVRVASCHPERSYCAKGLCRSCYNLRYAENNRERFRLNSKSWRRKYPEKVRAQRELAKPGQPQYFTTRQRHWKRNGVCPDTALTVYTTWQQTCGVCEMCGTSDNGGREFCVDHSHSPDANSLVRGVVCDKCNRALGNMEKGRRDYTPEAVIYSLRPYA